MMDTPRSKTIEETKAEIVMLANKNEADEARENAINRILEEVRLEYTRLHLKVPETTAKFRHEIRKIIYDLG